jgi:hypothetical protein
LIPQVYLNSEEIKLVDYRNWLNQCGVFDLNSKNDSLSFRSLLIRFARRLREACVDPLKTHKESDVEAQLRTFFYWI